jgi:hypothetical protein
MRDARGERSVIRVHRTATDASTNSLSSSSSCVSCVGARDSRDASHPRHLGFRCAASKLVEMWGRGWATRRDSS